MLAIDPNAPQHGLPVGPALILALLVTGALVLLLRRKRGRW